MEQQAAAGLVTREGAGWRLVDGADGVLADPDDPHHLAPLARQLVSIAAHVPDIAAGARTGHGLAWSAFGADMRESQADLNRPGFLGPLGTTWLPAIPAVHERLVGGARVADVGCGEAWSSIGIAQAYPAARVDAFDLDPASIAAAQLHVVDRGLESRVVPRLQDVADLTDDRYDLVTAFECLHDFAFPVEALRAMRGVLAEDGMVLVADMRTEDEVALPAGDVERLLFGWSIGVCLPDAMATPGSAMTGTVMRPAALRAAAEEAGFSSIEDTRVEHDLWRFWLLRP
ncbi:class I SAM-dependent methyltransferase [uncultured Amnibacterium sp.]|uniref:class I SAM-dependent methyltransferase n=1 Tax=uncultured Amnibacterium sp. TaxID=1631851 RepID=UPI0035C9C9C6